MLRAVYTHLIFVEDAEHFSKFPGLQVVGFANIVPEQSSAQATEFYDVQPAIPAETKRDSTRDKNNRAEVSRLSGSVFRLIRREIRYRLPGACRGKNGQD